MLIFLFFINFYKKAVRESIFIIKVELNRKTVKSYRRNPIYHLAK